jgi:aryl-alcohol dehydrogenase-like predicted oxidoreductase
MKRTTFHVPTRTQLSFFSQHFGVGSIPWSPLARGALTRPLGERSIRADNDTCVKKKNIPSFFKL